MTTNLHAPYSTFNNAGGDLHHHAHHHYYITVIMPDRQPIPSTDGARGRGGRHLNVILFGETGGGKSSIVNMLAGEEKATVRNGAYGVTFKHESYDIRTRNSTYRVFDTVGLNEGTKETEGTVAAAKAIVELYTLISQLDDGVSLLVYVMRAPRIKTTTPKNYDLFRTLCDGAVPMVIAITGLEDMDDMDEWWEENRDAFIQCKMSFEDVACITATRGRKRNGKYVYEAEYVSSKHKLEAVIVKNHSSTPWRMERQPWFARMTASIHDVMASTFRFQRMLPPKLRKLLRQYSGLTEEELKRMLKGMAS